MTSCSAPLQPLGGITGHLGQGDHVIRERARQRDPVDPRKRRCEVAEVAQGAGHAREQGCPRDLPRFEKRLRSRCRPWAGMVRPRIGCSMLKVTSSGVVTLASIAPRTFPAVVWSTLRMTAYRRASQPGRVRQPAESVGPAGERTEL